MGPTVGPGDGARGTRTRHRPGRVSTGRSAHTQSGSPASRAYYQRKRAEANDTAKSSSPSPGAA